MVVCGEGNEGGATWEASKAASAEKVVAKTEEVGGPEAGQTESSEGNLVAVMAVVTVVVALAAVTAGRTEVLRRKKSTAGACRCDPYRANFAGSRRRAAGKSRSQSTAQGNCPSWQRQEMS